jgi:hypothetical protein
VEKNVSPGGGDRCNWGWCAERHSSEIASKVSQVREGKLGRGEEVEREAAMDLYLRWFASASGTRQSGMDALPHWAASISCQHSKSYKAVRPRLQDTAIS